MAGAAAGSAAAYAAYGFSYQGSAPAAQSNRVSPVAFGAGAPSSSVAYKQNTGVVLPHPVARYEGNANIPGSGDEMNTTQNATNGVMTEQRNQDAT